MSDLLSVRAQPKTIAIVDAGEASPEALRAYIASLKRLSGAERVFALMDGDLDRAGGLARRDKYARAADLRAAGADCVVEMPLPTQMLADNLYAFAVRTMLQRLGCVDLLAVPCAGSRECFERTCAFLFAEPLPYQKRMRALRREGADPEAVFPAVVGEFVPGAEAFLSLPQNRMAVEYANILKRTYSTVRPFWLEATLPPAPTCSDAAQRDEALLRALAASFPAGGRQEALARAEDMCGGSARLARRAYAQLEAGGDGGFPAFARAVAGSDLNPAAVRRFLMSCLVGYRMLDSSVCITYSYIPYIRVLAAEADALACLRRTAQTTLLIDTAEERDVSQATDSFKQRLLRLDETARRLFLACVPTAE